MKTLTASRLPLFSECQYAWRDGMPWAEDVGGEAAEIGKGVHWALEMQALGRPHDRLLTPREERAIGGEMLISDGPIASVARGEAVLLENAYRMRISDGYVENLGPISERKYPKDAGWIYGTADAVTADAVIDYKTGRPENTKPAKENMQLLFLAYCAGVTSVHIHFIDESGQIFVDRHDTTREALVGVADSIRLACSLVDTSLPRINGGCKYCPARAVCPEVTKAMGSDIALPTTVDLIESPEHAAKMLSLLSVVEKRTEEVRDVLKEYARRNGSIPVGNGKEWRESTSEYTTTDNKRAAELIRDLGGRLGLDTSELIAETQRVSTRSQFRICKVR